MLDLGSGGGIDVILSAKRVGPTGTAYGLDMTDEMLTLAGRNAREAGVSNAHFLKGVIEEIPLPADSVDVVISNCVINLSTDKPAVLTEMAPCAATGRPDRHLGRRRRGSPLAGGARRKGQLRRVHRGSALRDRVRRRLEAAGFDDVSVHLTHGVADGMHGAIVKAVKTSEPQRSPVRVRASASAAL